MARRPVRYGEGEFASSPSFCRPRKSVGRVKVLARVLAARAVVREAAPELVADDRIDPRH
jgi:hypothetical protein